MIKIANDSLWKQFKHLLVFKMGMDFVTFYQQSFKANYLFSYYSCQDKHITPLSFMNQATLFFIPFFFHSPIKR